MDIIILMAQQLCKEGKTPTTALLKARLPKDISLPKLIKGLKMWKENPDQELNTPLLSKLNNKTDKMPDTSINDLIDSKIKQAIAPLLSQINLLQSEVNHLQKQLTKEDKS